MNEENSTEKKSLNDPQIYSKENTSFNPQSLETNGIPPASDLTQAPQEEASFAPQEIDLDTEEIIPQTERSAFLETPAQSESYSNGDTITEITLDDDTDKSQTSVQNTNPLPAPSTSSTINDNVTEIALDDESVKDPSESFQQINPLPDPSEAIQPETGLTKTEAEQNDEEQMRKGGGEVTLNTVTTYQDAIKEALQTQSMSGARLLMAEQRKRESREENDERDSIKTPINKIYVSITVFFIIMTVGAISAVVYFGNRPQEVDSQRAIKEAFFEPDGAIEVPQSQLGRNTILKIQQVLGSPVPKRGVQQVIVTKEVDGAPNSAVLVTTNAPYTRDDYFALTESRITDQLRQSLNQTVFLGIEAGNTNEPFMLFKVENYNNSFAGMIAWERTLIRDMSKIFSKGLGEIVLELERRNAIIEQRNAATRQASATALTIPIQTITSISIFEDEVISNTDARVIRNEAGQIVFFYTFINNEYLFMGTSARSLNEIQKKIRSAKLVL